MTYTSPCVVTKLVSTLRISRDKNWSMTERDPLIGPMASIYYAKMDHSHIISQAAFFRFVLKSGPINDIHLNRGAFFSEHSGTELIEMANNSSPR